MAADSLFAYVYCFFAFAAWLHLSRAMGMPLFDYDQLSPAPRLDAVVA